MFPVEKLGLGLHNPVEMTAKKYTISLRERYYMIGAVTDEMDFSTADHLQIVEGRGGKEINIGVTQMTQNSVE